MDIKKSIKILLKKALEKNMGSNILKGTDYESIDIPKNKKFGDFSTNVALLLAKKTKEAPLEIASRIEKTFNEELKKTTLAEKIDKIEIKEPGFINFFLSRNYLYETLLEIKKKKGNFGRSNLGKFTRVHLEFVSANPTGPLNAAHGRQAAFGDSLANLLDFSGYKVTREYYLNDEGAQIDLLGKSLRARYLEFLEILTEFPSSGYKGRYIDELAQELVRKYGRRFVKSSEKRLPFFSDFSYRRILKKIKKDLKDFGVRYNFWFSQKKLSKSGRVKKVLRLLKKKGFIYEKEGAWWLATTRFGDDKDRVVIKSDSTLTYITPDIAYHQTKFKRGFSRMINIWGPDHHGYIPRIKAAVSALGYEPERISFLIIQLVSIAKADKIIPMSTRLGQYISLSDIIQAVGKDMARFFFLMRKRDAHLHFDLELARKHSLENPVYYVQYAHARIENILRFAKNTKGFRIRFNRHLDLSVLDQPEEISLIQTLRKFPSVIKSCALNLEPHRVTTYLQELARDFHHYYEKHRVVTQDLNLTRARITLVTAAKIVISNGLRLLSISVPEKM